MSADAVRVDALSDEELCELLQWYPRPPAGAAARRELLLTAARNRFPDGRLPVDTMQEAS